MRKIFLEDVPKIGRYINWKQSVGLKIKFIYDNIEGIIEIIDYKDAYLTVKYNDIISTIMYTNFRKCEIAKLLGKMQKEYRYKDGDIIKVKTSEIEIIDKIRIGEKFIKGYKYRCLHCGNVDNISEYDLKSKGCNVCSGKKILKGYNDLWTLYPHIAKMLKFPEHGYEVSYGSQFRDWFLCPYCGLEKYLSIKNTVKQGMSCPKCGDGVSYPNKLIFNILSQLKIKFYTEKIFEWSKNIQSKNNKLNGYKRYDIFIPSLNCIIEMHGSQHYIKPIHDKARNLLEEKENDKTKEQLAKLNNIRNYIVIDCRISDLEYIKNNILQSKLSELVKLNSINWDECNKYATNNLIKITSNLWNEGYKNANTIAKILNIGHTTVVRYLKKGADFKWCDYNAKQVMKISHAKRGEEKSIKVICINTNEIFNSMKEGESNYNIYKGSISKCCRGKIKSAGKHPTTEEPLKWMYYKDYIESLNKENIIHEVVSQ